MSAKHAAKKIEKAELMTSAADSSSAGTAEGKENESRRKLLDAASELFAAKGFEGVSTRDIAAAAQVNISMISYYFNGKEGLYVAILEDFIEQNRAEYATMVTNFDVKNLTREKFSSHMKMIIGRLVERKFSCPHVSPLIFREILAGVPAAREFMENALDTMAQGLINLFEEARKQGIIKPDLHPATLFFSMIQAVDSYCLLSGKFPPLAKRCFVLPKQKDQYIDQVHKIFIEGALK